MTVEEINKAISEIPPRRAGGAERRSFQVYRRSKLHKEKACFVIVEEKEPEKPKPVVVGELFKTYVVAQVGDEMILMDKHAAHERYIFERIKATLNSLKRKCS